jgi:hypothetical protein
MLVRLVDTIVESIANVATRANRMSTVINLLVVYDASGNHDDAYFRNLGRLIRVKYDKATRVRIHVAQSEQTAHRCPSRFIRRVSRAIGSRLDDVRFFRYNCDNRLEMCTGQYDVYYLDSTSLAKVRQDVGRISQTNTGTMAMLRRMRDLSDVFSITAHNEPDNQLTRLIKLYLINEHTKSMPQVAFEKEDGAHVGLSNDDKCTLIMLTHQLG